MVNEKIDRSIRQPIFQIEREKHSLTTQSTDSAAFSMRDWQQAAFNEFKDASYMILEAPMGSGKSWLMCLLSAYKLRRDNSLKCIISVPQTIIAPGFAKAELPLPDGEQVHWNPRHNLCYGAVKKSNVQYVINWLAGSYETLNDRVLLCTHATLVKVYKEILRSNRLDLLANMLLWVDEAHHIKNTESSIPSVEGTSNEIGNLISHFLGLNANNIKIGLTTATFIRGDRCSLLTEEMEAKFTRYGLPFDVYFESMEHLKSFSFDFILCGPNYTKAIGLLALERICKDIVYIPHPISRHSLGDKSQDVQDIINEYHLVHKGEIVEEASGLISLKQEAGRFRILDLVDSDRVQRSKKKSILNENSFKEDREFLHAILAIGMFKEGANWIWADRSIIVGPRNSLVDVIQMIGRLFRDAPGKETVQVVQLLPFYLDQEKEEFCENLDNYLKTIYATLILEDIFKPVSLSTPKTLTSKQKEGGEVTATKKNQGIDSLIPNKSIISDVMQEGTKVLANLKSSNDPRFGLYETYQDKFSNILKEKFGIQESLKEICNKIWNMHERLSFKMLGNDVADIDFQIIKETHPLDGLLRFTSEACGISTLADFRLALAQSNDFDEMLLLCKDYINDTGSNRIAKNIKYREKNIGQWLHNQRMRIKHDSDYPQEMREKIESMPGYTKDVFKRNKPLTDEEWWVLLNKFVAREGHAKVPLRHKEEGYSLGTWVQKKRAQKDTMSKEEQQKFEALSHWLWNPREDSFENALSILRIYSNREGHCHVPVGHIENSFKLGKFVANIRTLYSQNKLSALNRSSLETIPGWTYSVADSEWEKGYNTLREYIKREGHSFIPYRYTENGFPLGRWSTRQRSAYRANPKRISQERIKKLELLPEWVWEPQQKDFETKLQLLKEFANREGHANVLQNYIEQGFLLGEFVSNLRESRKRLPPDVISILESLPGWVWNVHKDSWNKKFSLLERFYHEHGHINVPSRYIVEGIAIRPWLNAQLKKKNLKPDQKARLQTLGINIDN